MISADSALNAFATFFVTIDPPGQIAIFLAITAGISSAERKKIALLGTLIGIGVIFAFMLLGAVLLSVLGISIDAFRVAGGLLLFYTAFEMVFEKRTQRKEEKAERAISHQELKSIAVFPLAIPLIAGPGAISAAIILAPEFPGLLNQTILAGILISVGALLYLALYLSDRLDRHLGETGRIVLTRLFGIILAALSVQFVFDGVRELLA